MYIYLYIYIYLYTSYILYIYNGDIIVLVSYVLEDKHRINTPLNTN